MVIEYRGERVRRTVADARERRYRAAGMDCYLFTVDDDVVVDATRRGTIGRFTVRLGWQAPSRWRPCCRSRVLGGAAVASPGQLLSRACLHCPVLVVLRPGRDGSDEPWSDCARLGYLKSRGMAVRRPMEQCPASGRPCKHRVLHKLHAER